MDPTKLVTADRLPSEHDGSQSAAEPRLAATVALVDPETSGPRGRGALQITFVHRAISVAFAGGVLAFPGGKVDDQDFDSDVPLGAFDADQWAARLGAERGLARALIVAAVRETFEETGVLLTRPASPSGIGRSPMRVSMQVREDLRARLEARQITFAHVLRDLDVVADPERLVPWSRWLTPPWEPRRFRTWFFVAVVPDGEVPQRVSTEAQGLVTLSVRDAIAKAARHEALMLPPQYCTCLELFDLTDFRELERMSGRVAADEIMPTMAEGPDGHGLVLPERLVALGSRIGDELGLS